MNELIREFSACPTLRAAALALASAVLSGCMMAMHADGGMDGAASHAGSEPAQAAAGRVVKEFQRDNVRIVAEVPPLRAGKAARLVLRVQEVSGDKVAPVSAQADVTVRRQAADGAGAADADGRAPEAPRRMEGTSAPGVYELQHAFAEPGPYRIGFKVAIDAKPGGEQSLELTAVVAGEGGLWASMHGESNSLSALALGVLMVVMMVVFRI